VLPIASTSRSIALSRILPSVWRSQFLVHKTPESRTLLESLSQMASTLGELSETDAAVVAQLLANAAYRGTARHA